MVVKMNVEDGMAVVSSRWQRLLWKGLDLAEEVSAIEKSLTRSNAFKLKCLIPLQKIKF